MLAFGIGEEVDDFVTCDVSEYHRACRLFVGGKVIALAKGDVRPAVERNSGAIRLEHDQIKVV